MSIAFEGATEFDYRHVRTDMSEITPEQSQVLAYWNELSSEKSLPSWTQFELIDLPSRLVPRVHVFDVVDDGADYLCRFWGSQLTTWVGVEMTGKTADKMHKSKRLVDAFIVELTATIEGRKPIVSHARIRPAHGEGVFQTILRLPLAGASGEVDHCLTAVEFWSDSQTSREFYEHFC